MPAVNPLLTACLQEFARAKHLAEGAFAQLTDAHFHVRINPHQNSIAQIVQHMSGNMLSRWTDFLTTDGEKPGRNREGEFADRRLPRAELMALWDGGWAAVRAALEPLSDDDLLRVVYIRNEPHTVFQAINRQTAHYSLHVGQILLIAKHLVGADWKYLSIAPGASAAFNATRGLQA